MLTLKLIKGFDGHTEGKGWGRVWVRLVLILTQTLALKFIKDWLDILKVRRCKNYTTVVYIT